MVRLITYILALIVTLLFLGGATRLEEPINVDKNRNIRDEGD